MKGETGHRLPPQRRVCLCVRGIEGGGRVNRDSGQIRERESDWRAEGQQEARAGATRCAGDIAGRSSSLSDARQRAAPTAASSPWGRRRASPAAARTAARPAGIGGQPAAAAMPRCDAIRAATPSSAVSRGRTPSDSRRGDTKGRYQGFGLNSVRFQTTRTNLHKMRGILFSVGPNGWSNGFILEVHLHHLYSSEMHQSKGTEKGYSRGGRRLTQRNADPPRSTPCTGRIA